MIIVLWAILAMGCGQAGLSDTTRCGVNSVWTGNSCECLEGFSSSRGVATDCIALVEESGKEADSGVDAGGLPDAGVESVDAGSGGDGGEVVSFEANRAVAEYASSHGGDQLWRYDGTGSTDRLIILNDTAYGGRATVGEYALKAKDASFQTCGVCVVYQRGCSGQTCSEAYMPESNGQMSVEFLALGKSEGSVFSLTTSDLTLRQVRITNSATTVVTNGKRLVLKAATWSAGVLPPECGGHGHLHGTVCHCDSGYKLDPQNTGNCIPQ